MTACPYSEELLEKWDSVANLMGRACMSCEDYDCEHNANSSNHEYDGWEDPQDKFQKKAIVFDFDGVLCEYRGWRGHDAIGKPKKEWVEAVKRWHSWGHTLKLNTTRLNKHPFGEREDKDVVDGTALKHVEDWLRMNGIYECFSEISAGKSYADIIIDDKMPGFGDWPPERIEEHYKLNPLESR